MSECPPDTSQEGPDRPNGPGSLKPLLVMIFGALLACVGFSAIAEEVTDGPESWLKHLDDRVLLAFAHLRSPHLNGSVIEFSALGSRTLVATIVIVSLSVFALFRRWLGVLQLVLAGAGGGLLMLLAKHVFARPRPEQAHRLVAASGFSFPSGHSLVASATYISLALLACQQLRGRGQRAVLLGLAVVVVIGVALSRVYLGVHYPSDVAAGLCLGTGWALLLQAALSFWVRRRAVKE